MPIIAGRASAAYGAGFGAVTTIPSTLVGSYDALASVTVGAGGLSSIDFIGIPTDYSHLQIRGIARSTVASDRDDILMRINSDASSAYGGHQINGTGSGVNVGTLGGTPTVTYLYPAYVSAGSNTANIFGTFIIDVLDYATTSKYKTWKSFSGIDLNGSGNIMQRSGFYENFASITSINFSMSNFAQYSQISLYGVR